MSSRHRRASFTIWPGHLPEVWQDLLKGGCKETTMNLYFQETKRKVAKYQKDANVIRGVAMALEVGTENRGIHVQGYIELTSARSWSWYGKLFNCYPECFQTTRSGVGSYEYVTATGNYQDKEGVLENWQSAPRESFRLHDISNESKADLKWCVGHIVEGYHPEYILKTNPYAYTVHRARIWGLWHDLQEMERYGRLRGPASKNMEVEL